MLDALDGFASWIRLRVRANCASISAPFLLSFLAEAAISAVISCSATLRAYARVCARVKID